MEESCSMILVTNRNDIENLVRTKASRRYRIHPKEFAGEELCIHYKLRYEIPCQSFHELRNYILRVKDSTGLRSDFRGFIAINISEWIGHEDEEYFEIFLKYLSDHQKYKQYIFIIQGESMMDYKKMIYKIMSYMEVQVKEDMMSKDRQELYHFIQASFENRDIHIESKVIDWLIDVVFLKDKIDLFNETLRESIINELILYSDKKMINYDSLEKYMNEEKTILGLLGVKGEFYIESKQL